MIVFLFGILLRTGVSDPVYNVKANLPLCDFLASNIENDDILIVDSYPEPIWYFLSAYECRQGVWYSLPYGYANNQISYERAQNLLSELLDNRKSRVWFVFDEADYSSSALREDVIAENNYDLVDELHYPSAIIALYIRVVPK